MQFCPHLPRYHNAQSLSQSSAHFGTRLVGTIVGTNVGTEAGILVGVAVGDDMCTLVGDTVGSDVSKESREKEYEES